MFRNQQSDLYEVTTRHMVDCPVDTRELLPKWFAVYTNARHEKRVAEHFGLRAIEFFLPLYKARRKWKDGSTVDLNLPLFPGYIFVRISPGSRVRVLGVPGVLWIVGGKNVEAAAIADANIYAIQASLSSYQVEPHPLLIAGQRVRIRKGALAGIEGIVVRNKNGLRVVITLELIMQSIAVEVDGHDLEPI